jgi:hypothetical protein
MIGVAALLIISISANTMFHKTIELEKAKVVEAEATKRGHWLWGTKSQDVADVKKIIQDGKSKRGHWLWGHWDDVAEKQEPTEEHE